MGQWTVLEQPALYIETGPAFGLSPALGNPGPGVSAGWGPEGWDPS